MSALFLDRDGVINENREQHVRCWQDFQFLPGAVQSLATLSRAGFQLVVLTNQSIIGRGLVSWSAVRDIHERMCRAVSRAGGTIADILVCPHPPDAGCACRKPRPGLVLEARRRYCQGESSVHLVGDHLDDVAAAIAGGCHPILVETGRGQQARPEVERQYGARVTYMSSLTGLVEFLVDDWNPTGR